MIKVGEPFKMLPLTRKAENALWRASDLLGIHREEVRWQRFEARAPACGLMLVVAIGDQDWSTLRWVQTQNDPDWKIV